MNNNLQSTSLFAYETIKPVTGKMRKEVLTIITRLGKCTAKKIASELRIPINKVTGRINELMYQHQSIKVVGVESPKMQNIYAIRKESDPVNTRNLTPEQKLKVYRSWLSNQGLYVDVNKALKKLDEIIDKYQ